MATPMQLGFAVGCAPIWESHSAIAPSYEDQCQDRTEEQDVDGRVSLEAQGQPHTSAEDERAVVVVVDAEI